jgi:hypothetical protein
MGVTNTTPLIAEAPVASDSPEAFRPIADYALLADEWATSPARRSSA